MSIRSLLRAVRSPDAACARALFSGRGLAPGAPPGQQALARALEAAAGPGTAEELAAEVAAAAAFVQVTSQRKPRRTTRQVLAAAACAVAVGGTAAYAIAVPSTHRTTMPVPFGVPRMHHAAPVTRVPPRLPGRQQNPRAKASAVTRRPVRQPTRMFCFNAAAASKQAGCRPIPFPPRGPASRHRGLEPVERLREAAMVAIHSRWHDGGILNIPAGTPAKQAALAFALYGLRLQAEGISPGPIEATVTIADKNGHPMGQLDLDARDVQWMTDTISAMLHQDYGPWRTEDLNRLLTKYSPGQPG